jgi:hypothetical protein
MGQKIRIQSGSDKNKSNPRRGKGLLYFLGKLVGRTFGMQSLREIGRLMCEFPRIERGPVPEVLLSRLSRKIGLYHWIAV